MRLLGKAALERKNDRALAGLEHEIRMDLGACEQRIRRDYAQIEKIRTIRAQRRIQRPNL